MVRTAKANLIWVAALGAVLLTTAAGLAETKGPLKPSREDKCPVCGMFVYRYPDWIGEIIFKDGSAVFFDGTKDLVKYYSKLKEYSPGRTKRDIAAIYVTEYYDMKMIDVRKALFVIGSDVYGPMGHELIPLNSEADARTFMTDHRGKRILRFDEITPEVIAKLD